jgi:hypothetical protein
MCSICAECVTSTVCEWINMFNKSRTSMIQNTQDAHPWQQVMTNRNSPEPRFSRTEWTLNEHQISAKAQVNEQCMKSWDPRNFVHGGFQRNWQKNPSTTVWAPGLVWWSNMTKQATFVRTASALVMRLGYATRNTKQMQSMQWKHPSSHATKNSRLRH